MEHTRSAFYEEIIPALCERKLSKEELQTLKRDLTAKHGMKGMPSDIDILVHATDTERNAMKLKLKPVRTIAGVTPVAIMSAPFPCPHGKCRMCPDHLKEGIPMSYTGKEPASMRGLRANWDAFLQVFARLEQYVVTGHIPQKCDVIVMGGTFPSYPLEYQEGFIRDMFLGLNIFGMLFYPNGELDIKRFTSFFDLPRNIKDPERAAAVQERIRILKEQYNTVTLEEAQLTNETAQVRCIGLTFETRPDCALIPHSNLMLRLGGTRVELGVQSVYDDCLTAVYRAHDSALNKKSIQILRDLGFKLNFHIMPGMPGLDKERISYERDLEGLKQLFSDPAYRPDMLKLYPLMVMPNTPMLKDYQEGLFHPMGTEEAAKLLQEYLPHVEPYCRIMRVQRDIPTYRTVAGVGETNLRQRLNEDVSRDIRSREIGTRELESVSPEIIVIEYEASGGQEFFISYEDLKERALLGYVRMRFPKEFLRPEITPKTALIRELHVYGEASAIKGAAIVQHHGIGSLLLKKAEEIAVRKGMLKMVVIAGVGVRGYYIKKHGYRKEGPYVSKLV